MRIIYADSTFLLNFTVDYLLLLATGKICALPLVRRRMALGAVWGGLYAVLCLLWPGLFALGSVKILAGAGCAAIAFGFRERFARTAVVFFAVSAAFAGCIYAVCGLAGVSPGSAPLLGLSTRTLVLSFALCYALLSLVFRGVGRRGSREIYEAEINLRGRKAVFRALRDTGNELRDPSGNSVMTVGWAAAAKLFPEISSLPNDPAGLCLSLASLDGMAGRCRVLPCTTVTDSSGLLAAFRPDAVLIGGESVPHTLIAISPGPMSADGEYQAVF